MWIHRHGAGGRGLFTVCAALVFLLTACAGADEPEEEPYAPIVTFDSTTARVITASDTIPIVVEVAEREDQRAWGLMERLSLPDDRGMIFLHTREQPAEGGFWMYRTRIPLDIAYIDADGIIVGIRAMEPCPRIDPDSCPSYPAGAAFYSALEMNRGWFAERGVGVGDRVEIDAR
jgi:uncharacterized protein